MDHKHSNDSTKDWIRRRAIAIYGVYGVFDVLTEFGHGEMLVDQSTPIQISCPLPEHGPDNRPSARFYPGESNKYDHFHCFKCKVNMDCINLYAKFKGIKFIDALVELERRFRIRVPRRPEAPEFTEPADRGSNYISDKWSDVAKMLPILEAKLIRLREKIPMQDYVKFCRVIDSVQWDLDKALGKPNAGMAPVLMKLKNMMDSSSSDELY